MLDKIFDTLLTVCINWCDYYVTIECAQSAYAGLIDAQWKWQNTVQSIQDYIFTRLYRQSLYGQGDQGKYEEYTPPFHWLLVKTRAIRFCKWPAQISDTVNNRIRFACVKFWLIKMGNHAVSRGNGFYILHVLRPNTIILYLIFQ